ncbi:CRISPR system Cascade subunit CasC [Parafrankia irregularis]|uniref:CRISPR system Cascade subunit CasC n=1 Tax=Parafrankia irregularis TaxID=795642 RepID=A0A0S4QML2_9ACTN|nr:MULTISPECIES: type I-E CRISPR-associated protein Cas7/Cse4/CasC [Parafrankia]MBE3200226.1 type I-E CRISPR-associated protein Cas7/Cse4/CasC [Parafrankia sp. CH37]CUU56580.1 CRISPR system Cascade subunit CasC [Parafrankia irregularis]
MTARFVDIHLLQPVPYANLNRDDLGAPKTVVYGGKSRTRVSSQCWKRQVRLEVETALDDPAVRTRRIISAVAERLTGQGWPAELATYAGRQVLLSAGKKGIKTEAADTGNGEGNGGAKGKADKAEISSVLLYLPAAGLDELAVLAAAHRDRLETEIAKKPAQQRPVLPVDEVAAILSSRTGTINLFGRMLAELPGGKVDGAVQVAHAFTVHATDPEVDFFTAVDDIPAFGDAGSGHMNAGEFSAGVFYRYASLDLAGLVANLDGDKATAFELTRHFLGAFVAALPSGKRTATAPNTLPELIYVAVRQDRPISLAAAFERPVPAGIEGGHGEPAREVLSDYATGLHRFWGTDQITLHGQASIDGKARDGLGDSYDSWPALLDATLAAAAREESAEGAA